jgi:uncharacterized membrane protein YeaQ/YmgE (transglycosylase-associated protein family)
MALTVVLWLLSGAVLVALAWHAAADTFPAGIASCAIVGVGGAFVGGELFVVLSGGPARHDTDPLTLLGSTAGALLFIELVSRPHPSSPKAARSAPGRLLMVWLSLQLWSPVLFAAALGAALGRANDSPLLALATTVVTVLFLGGWNRHHARLRI